MATPNMNLTLPVVSQTPGPTWATEINGNLDLIDLHNHTSGNGALVPVAGLDIDADLSLATHALTDVTKAVLLNQASVATSNAVYAKAGDLWWTNGGGTPVQVTSGGSVFVGGTGNIGGLPNGSAAVNYVSGPLAYEFLDENGNEAALLGSTVGLYNLTLSGTPGSSIYTLRFPISTPVAPSFVTATVSGSIATLAFNNQSGYVTRPMQASVDEQKSTTTSPSTITSTFPTFVNASSTITVVSTGRPIFVGIMSSEGSSPSYSYIRMNANTAGWVGAYLQVDVSGSATTKIMAQRIAMYSGGNPNYVDLPNSLTHLYVPPAPGTYTFQLEACVEPSGGGYVTTTLDLSFPILYAYEL